MVADANYRTISVVRAGNGLMADEHEFLITAHGSAYVLAYSPVALNLSAAASRVPVEQLQEEFLPALLRTAGAISTALGRSSRSAERSGPVVSAV